MNISAEKIDFKGETCVELKAGDYHAIIAPFLGSNVMKLENTALHIDILRNDPALTPDELKADAVVYGMPTLYLPNRLSKGDLKTSDAMYHFPLNDPLGNYIHGFLHLRTHTIDEVTTSDDCAVAKTSYVYDENDPIFDTFPVSFKAAFTFTLSAEGLSYEFTMTNLSSDKQLPYGVGNHTAFKAPFTEGGSGVNVRLQVPIRERLEIDKACIPTEKRYPLSDYDMMYKNGDMVPVRQDIDNDLYAAAMEEPDGKPFYGAVLKDLVTGKKICYEVCDVMKFWIIWNGKGEKGFCCPEPMSWNINAPNLSGRPSETGYTELAPGESKTVTERIFIV